MGAPFIAFCAPHSSRYPAASRLDRSLCLTSAPAPILQILSILSKNASAGGPPISKILSILSKTRPPAARPILLILFILSKSITG